MTAPIDYGPPRKRSLTLRGHRTSVSLEDPFWAAFLALARQKGMAINALAVQIDADRGLDCGLAGAIRLYVLAHSTLTPAPRCAPGDTGT